jgi:heme exporter protein B
VSAPLPARIEARAGLSLFLRQVLTIAGKDLRSELRTKEALNASVAFSIVILVLFSFAIDPGAEQFLDFSGGLLWMVFMFAGALVLNRSFAREIPNDCLDALLAAPLPISALFTGKALANFALLFVVELVALPVFGLFYDIRWLPVFWPLTLVMALGTWGLTVIGTVFSALTVNLRLREMIPALVAAMTLTTDLLSGIPIAGNNLIWIRVLVAFDFIFTAVAATMIDSVLMG